MRARQAVCFALMLSAAAVSRFSGRESPERCCMRSRSDLVVGEGGKICRGVRPENDGATSALLSL